jgi:hypothetical protein
MSSPTCTILVRNPRLMRGIDISQSPGLGRAKPSQATAKTEVGALALQVLFLKEAKAALSQTKAPASAFRPKLENPYMIQVH